MGANSRAPEMSGGAYTGWIASLLIVAVVLGVGAVLWFSYHP